VCIFKLFKRKTEKDNQEKNRVSYFFNKKK
jgi:hypothetical protein